MPKRLWQNYRRVATKEERDFEARFLALLILVHQYDRGDARERVSIAELSLRNTRWINNWALVDSSARHVLGRHLEARSRALLKKLARSANLWQRRIAMIATHHFILKGDHADALNIAAMLSRDEHDLIHKASGWMLREVGKRDRAALRGLAQHAHEMPKTMLRYAIEHLDDGERAGWRAAKAKHFAT